MPTSTGIPYFISLHFIALHKHYVLLQIEDKKIMTCFFVILVLLQWFLSESTISLKYVCVGEVSRGPVILNGTAIECNVQRIGQTGGAAPAH